jgi:hypothetical protein
MKKKTVKSLLFFALLGCAQHARAAKKMMVKLARGLECLKQKQPKVKFLDRPEQLHVGNRQSRIPWRMKAWQAWPQPKGRVRQTEKNEKKFSEINLINIQRPMA